VNVKRIAGKDTTLFTIPVALLDRINAGKLAYLDRSLKNFPLADVSKLVIARPKDKVTYEIEKDKKDGKDVWTIKQPKEFAGRPADTSKVQRILEDLSKLRAEKWVAEKGTPKELGTWGLDPARITVTVTVRKEVPAKDEKKEEKKDEPKDDKKEAKKEEKKEEKKPDTEEWVYLFGVANKEGAYYAKQGKEDLVFLVNDSNVKPLEGDLLDLQVFNFDPKKLKQLKLSWKPVDKKPAVLDLIRDEKEKTWTVNQKDLADFTLDANVVELLVDRLARLKADKLLAVKAADNPALGLGPGERLLQIELTLDGEKEPLTLTIGKLLEKEKGYAATGGSLKGDALVVSQDTFQKLIDGGVKYFAQQKKE
jgi:hypothetical protein